MFGACYKSQNMYVFRPNHLSPLDVVLLCQRCHDQTRKCIISIAGALELVQKRNVKIFKIEFAWKRWKKSYIFHVQQTALFPNLTAEFWIKVQWLLWFERQLNKISQQSFHIRIQKDIFFPQECNHGIHKLFSQIQHVDVVGILKC